MSQEELKELALIEPHWNVNLKLSILPTFSSLALIEPHWNVNYTCWIIPY